MFKFKKTEISGLTIIEPQIHEDQRGFFMETYQQKAFEQNGIKTNFVQDNHSKSSKGILRGLHVQTKNTQAKLVRVVVGSVYDVAVDLRKESPTYGKRVGVILSSTNKKQLFIPKGFAHGFLSLEENTELIYKCDDYYNPQNEKGIIYSDKNIGINWQTIIKTFNIEKIIVSEKDKNYGSLKEFYNSNPF